MASNKPLKRSISLDNSKFPASDTEDANSENYEPAMSRRSRRKIAKKTKLSDQPQSQEPISSGNGAADDVSHVSFSTTDTQSSQVLADDSHEQLDGHSSQSCNADHGGCDCASVIRSLKLELGQLQETVKLLSSQVNVLSSTLGVSFSAQTTQVPANDTAPATDSNRKSSYASVASSVPAVRQMHRNMV